MRQPSRLSAPWQWVVKRWNGTPGYLKWLGGLLLGALLRLLFAKLFPESWDRLSRQLFDPTMPIWLAVVVLVSVLVLERSVAPLYRRLRAARSGDTRLHPLFGVRWAVPPVVDHLQGPYCTVCPTRLRGTMWSGESSPTLWTCPSCRREFKTPEFADITREAERHFGVAHGPPA